MIRAKLGWSSMAVKTLALYTGAICRANLLTPPAPKASLDMTANDRRFLKSLRISADETTEKEVE